MSTDITWIETGKDRLVSYIKMDQIPCRVLYDPKLATLGLYIQMTSKLDYRKVLEAASKMLGQQATLGSSNGKLFIVKSKVSIRDLEASLRCLLYAGFAVLGELN